ncbi:MAG: LuxR C-terminal-related transcriptional regulator [Anaerolineae bacterium]
MDTPLLTAKLYTPLVRPEVVPRPALIERLNAGLRRKLTLVSAPAGYGKTTLLAQWVPQCGRPAAWLSLDEGDNDPARFWTYVVGALRTVRAEIGQIGQMVFQSPPPPIEAALTGLLNQVVEAPDPFVLVLDDYHLIGTPAIHEGVAFLLENLPPQMHIVVATRADPPLPIPRLRGRGQLTELYQSDLRFTREEAARFLNETIGLHLPVEDVAALERRTEGWIAGLHMAAASMRRHNDVAGFIQAFTGTHRYILDYLVEEVLQQQSPAVRQFLLQTSILDRLCSALCDAVIGVDEPAKGRPAIDSQSVLEHLERNNLFVVPLDDGRQWYRYHRLFADLLQQRLQREQRDLVPELHRRASVWYEENGAIREAVNHALAARDYERMANLVGQNAWAVLARGEMITLLQWLDGLPDEMVRSRSQLAMFRAWVLALSGQLDNVDACLAGIEDQDWQGEAAAVRAYVAHHRGDPAGAIVYGEEALKSLPEAHWFSRGIVAVILGIAPLSMGDPVAASRALTRAIEYSRSIGQTFLTVTATTMLGEALEVQGSLGRAIQTHRNALQLALERSVEPVPVAGMAYVGLAGLLYERNDLDGARRCAEEGLELSRQARSVDTIEDACYTLALVHQATGDIDRALETIQEVKDVAQQHGHSDWLAIGAATRSQLWLRQGDLAAASHWAHESCRYASNTTDIAREFGEIARVRVLVARDRAGETASGDGAQQALHLLTTSLQAAEAAGRIGSVIRLRALQAVALQIQGKEHRSLAALEQVLALGEPEGYVRTFLDEGEPMARLLRQALSRGIAPNYVARLLAAFGEEAELASPGMEALVEPLTEREVEVLRLLVAGLSNAEIAEELVIAVSTVKSHVNHIYGKLGVENRTQAVIKVQELDLL